MVEKVIDAKNMGRFAQDDAQPREIMTTCIIPVQELEIGDVVATAATTHQSGDDTEKHKVSQVHAWGHCCPIR